ncbi:group I truncated hemoglobin [Pseudidiomarina insulisalsae]|uniref:Group 1 truncated hemoglobin n=1 Tax=Pseudidiomarina insulisalsae TaxID=575789 RepID=A0A432YEW9_9GAMM|nr:group 1 truncated hemoglobin [Pseudidiomarina insulisalsae]RUO59470.1 group 1 truncated hemoglobin [Pseudidiomarina insulisalsae]
MLSVKKALFGALLLLSVAPSSALSSELYQQLGKKAGIDQLMTTFVFAIAEDERVIEHFARVDIERFHQMISQHVCELVGGPCRYEGADMVEVHTGMAITRAEFNAIVENLIHAMEQEQVPLSAQNQLLAILAQFHGDIVGK